MVAHKDGLPTADKPMKTMGALETLRALEEAYGWKLLGMLVFSQWLIKGLVWGFSIGSMEFLFREYAVSGPRLQIYKAIVMLPWAMKPIFGLISDALPIMGYRKGPYMAISSIVAVVAYGTVGLAEQGALQIRLIVLCLMFGCMQASVCDLLTEARYAEAIRKRPEHGPDLMTFVWGGITAGTLLATASVGFVIEHLGAQHVGAIVMVPSALILIPTCLNWMEEKKLTQDQIAKQRAKLWEQKELLFLVMLTGAATLTLVGVGLLQDSVWVNLAVACVSAVVVVFFFTVLLKPVIGKMNCFFFIQTCFVVDISGATFYFFTDTQRQYPEGPHFSKIFFASVLGVFVAILNLIGMWTYNRYMKVWRYHSLFIFANLLVCVVNLLALCVYTRFNLSLGVPDSFFVLGTWGAWAIVHMWMWIPGVVLLSQLCPQGVEATMYALLAGCHNLGLSTASYLGACLLKALEIAPTGAANEGHQFDNLWVAALVQAVAPMMTLVLLPYMIPNALQTEKLLDSEASATEGSPWKRLCAWWRPAGAAARPTEPAYGSTNGY